MSFASMNLSPKENEAVLRSIGNDVIESGWFKLPRYLEERPNQPFVCFVMLKAKPGMSQAVVDISRDIRAETDQNELEVYAHRTLQSKYEADRDMLSIVIDYDSAEAFRIHYKGKNVERLYKANVLSEPPKLNFFVDI